MNAGRTIRFGHIAKMKGKRMKQKHHALIIEALVNADELRAMVGTAKLNELKCDLPGITKSALDNVIAIQICLEKIAGDNWRDTAPNN